MVSQVDRMLGLGLELIGGGCGGDASPVDVFGLWLAAVLALFELGVGGTDISIALMLFFQVIK